MQQVGLKVLPTRTIYDFEEAGVHLTLTFLTPLLPSDLDLVSRPVTYLAWQVRAIDHRSHDVQIYYDNSAEPVVDQLDQQVVWSRPAIKGLLVQRIGSLDQPVLKQSGDNRRIDWGYLYTAAPADKGTTQVVGGHEKVRLAFAATGTLLKQDDPRMPRAAGDDFPVAACEFDLGSVGIETKSCYLMLAYDDEFSIEYLGTKLRPYWRRNGMDAARLLSLAADDYGRLNKACEAFDKDLMADLTRVGGEGYAQLCALSYRQAIGGHKLAAAPDGRPMLFPKECFSNGCISTVDVIYPAAPILAALQQRFAQGFRNARLRLCCQRALDISLRAARFGNLSQGRWAGLRRRRAQREGPNAGRGVGQHADPRRDDIATRRQYQLCAKILAPIDPLGGLSQAGRARSFQSALHRRFRRTLGSQYEPLA